MIKKSRPITMAEVAKVISGSDRVESVKLFIKGFDVLDFEKAKEVFDEIKALDLVKLKDEHIVKIVDFLPTDITELNKAVSDLSLDQNEIDKILEITKKCKQ